MKLVLLLCMVSLGCAVKGPVAVNAMHPSRHAQTVDMVIPRDCVKSDVKLKRCDAKARPVKCSNIMLDYVQGCEVVKTATKGETK